MTYTGPCRRCGGTTFTRTIVADGAYDTCRTCHHPRQGDPSKVHRLLNGGKVMSKAAGVCHVDGCDRPVKDALVCSTCWSAKHGSLKSALEKVPWLAGELDIAVTRQTRFSEQTERVKGSTETPVVFAVDASEARAELRAVLVGWIRLVHESEGAA
jgi:hypothetical protein